jgi:7-cyano-7-deazaguanine synthase
MPKAIVLLSGGLDSATTLALAQADGFEIYAMTFSYGQRHFIEIASAKAIAEAANVVTHNLVEIDLRAFGNSSLTDEIAVPQNRTGLEMSSGIPSTYVPARNTIFLSYALAWADTLGIFDIFIGVNSLDYAGYPDCRPEYIAAYSAMANLAIKSTVEPPTKMTFHTPIISMTKADIIKAAVNLEVAIDKTLSCYSPNHIGHACGKCDACILRLDGFSQNNLTDPITYQA